MENKIYNVKNRSASVVVYSIPEEGIRREFAPSETKKISKEELDKLTYQAGGRELMINFLQIQDAGVREELNLSVEPEYEMSEEQIADLIMNGSLDQFIDCLNFAPIGVKDLVKEMAVMLPMTDTNKISVLKEKTGFDLNTALANKAAEAAEGGAPAGEDKPVRRVVSTNPERRTNVDYTKEKTPAQKYKVVSTPEGK